MFGTILTDNIQFLSQFVDTNSISKKDERNNVQITDNLKKNTVISYYLTKFLAITVFTYLYMYYLEYRVEPREMCRFVQDAGIVNRNTLGP